MTENTTSAQHGAAPRSGIAGLKHWRHDALAGFQVALLWTPFSLGVALASGAPAVAGLVSAIVAGLLYPLLGGSYVTVSGPAAALAPVLLWGMLTLGHGDLAAGYPLVLVAIVLTGVAQLLLAALKAGRYASLLPVTVVEAMLAAIGIMIIIRQVPALVGAPSVPARSVLEGLANLPQQLLQAHWAPALIGALGLALMFGFRRLQRNFWRWIPAAIVVSGMGVVLGLLLGLPETLKISMPAKLIDGIAFPAFATLLADPTIWVSMALVVLTFTMIDGVESVASVKAVDKIDPWRRKSDANKTLRAMGVCNLASGMLGGLTVIPNAVPSRANIDAGARTLWSNFYSGLFLLVFALLLPGLLSLIPLAAIAAILIYIGWRLCEPAIFVRMTAIGRDRLLVFVGTIAAILLTDLLKGMLIGVLIELTLLMYLLVPSLRWIITGRLTFRDALTLHRSTLLGLFRTPVIRLRSEAQHGGQVHIVTLSSFLGFNTLHLEQLLARLPKGDEVVMRFTESAKLIDHSAMEHLQHLEEEFAAEGRGLRIEGLDQFQPFANHPLASRLQDANVKQLSVELDARARAIAALAAQLGLSFSPHLRATVNRDNFVYLRRGDQREERNTMEGDLLGMRVRVFDYSHTSAPDYNAPRRHTLILVQLPQGAAETAAATAAVEVVVPGHYLERYLVDLREVPVENLHGHRLYSSSSAASEDFMRLAAALIAALGPLYIERRESQLLLFAPEQAWETPERLAQCLHAIAEEIQRG